MKLCAGTERASNGTKLAYEGSPFHRIIPNFMIQVSYRLGSFCFVAVKNTFYSRWSFSNAIRELNRVEILPGETGQEVRGALRV